MNWVRARKLGHGSFATVSLAVPRNDSAPLMAVKTCGCSSSATLANEKSILDELSDCPEIIKCYGDCFTYENNDRLYNLLLEFAPEGTLHDRLRACADRRMQESEAVGHARALLRGLRRIHDSGYAHCDVKLQNLLLFPDGVLKIADFGLARKVSVAEDSTGELRGTPLYMSPEVLAGGEPGPPSDIWALGCCLVEMLAGAPLWGGCSSLAELAVKIGGCDWSTARQSVLSDVARDFIGKCLARDPSDRWTAEMLLSHPFVCGGGDDDDEERRSKGNCASTSPRYVFDFPEDYYTSSVNFAITYLPSSDLAVGRLRVLVDCGGRLDWSVSDDWVTVR